MTDKNGPGGVDLARFQTNQRNVDPAAVLPYRGKHIAWNAEGTAVVASGDSYEALFEELDRLGIPTDQIVHDFVDSADGLL
jgi:hypothetical protein